MSTLYLFHPWKDFHYILAKCLPQLDNVQNPLLNHADSRLQLHVTILSPEFRVRSISPLPLEEFSLMFASVKRCAESITQQC